MTTPGVVSLPDHFRSFADVVERDGGTIYPAICRGAAEDPEVLALLDLAPVAQRRPLLLLASVHFLLLSGTEHPLACFYDTVTMVRGTSDGEQDDRWSKGNADELYATFSDFCREHRRELEGLIATRSTQTNEVGRCALLLPALCHIADEERRPEPLNLLDLGTSAGLNLLYDDYAYTYRAPKHRARNTGDARSRVRLECAVRGTPDTLPDLRFPAVAERVGLDIAPVDARSEDAARWLLACQWPDNPPRFARVRAALANFRASTSPPRLVRGDIVDDLADTAGAITGPGPLVIFHSWVAAYLDVERQRELVAAIRTIGCDRPVHHLYCEAPFETAGLPTPPCPVARRGPDLATAVVHIGPESAPPVRLADAHPHGAWIRWWPPVIAA